MAKRKPEEAQQEQDPVEGEVIYDFSRKYKIQVRIEDGGKTKRDGRRGQIVLEDPEAPESVKKWLLSPACRKSERGPGGRRQCYLWIDDVMVPTLSVDIPDFDAEPEPSTALAAVSAQVAETEAAKKYLAHLLSEIKFAEQDLTETRTRVQGEIKAALEYRDEELRLCNALIDDVRARLAKELEREDEAMKALGERRAQQAKQMVEDDTIFGLVRASHGKKLLAQEEKSWARAALETPAGMLAVGLAADKMGIPPAVVNQIAAALGLAPKDAAEPPAAAPPVQNSEK